MMWSVTIFLWADVCSRLRLPDRALEIYERLAPCSDQLAVSGAMVRGLIPWALGALATNLERYDEAEAHFAAAAEMEGRPACRCSLPAPAGWARALTARGRPEDLGRADRAPAPPGMGHVGRCDAHA
jgi:hypothetical protein